MAFIPVPNTVLIEFVYSWIGQVCENTLYCEFGDTPSTTIMTDLAADLVTSWSTFYQGNMVDDLALNTVRVRDLSDEFSPGIEYVTGLPLVGEVISNSMPTEVAACVTFLTALRGRSFRGRNYIPGLSETHVDGNTIASAWRTAMVAAYQDLAAAMVTNGGVHVVVSRVNNGVPRVTGLTTVVTSYRIDEYPDSQRRRRHGYGN